MAAGLLSCHILAYTILIDVIYHAALQRIYRCIQRWKGEKGLRRDEGHALELSALGLKFRCFCIPWRYDHIWIRFASCRTQIKDRFCACVITPSELSSGSYLKGRVKYTWYKRRPWVATYSVYKWRRRRCIFRSRKREGRYYEREPATRPRVKIVILAGCCWLWISSLSVLARARPGLLGGSISVSPLLFISRSLVTFQRETRTLECYLFVLPRRVCIVLTIIQAVRFYA